VKPRFFSTPEKFRQWLDKNHDQTDELLVGFYKVASGKPSITWPESVDEALCFGWIDGVRRRVDDESYTIRFTPRRPDSFWSAKNIASVARLQAAGRMQPAGLAAFEARKDEKSGAYSFEQGVIPEFTGELLQRFQAARGAWDFFGGQPPSYRKSMRHWVLSAKREETRLRRLERLIAVSAAGERVDLMSPFGKKA